MTLKIVSRKIWGEFSFVYLIYDVYQHVFLVINWKNHCFLVIYP